MVKATPYCMDSDKWKAMTKEQQQAIWTKVRKFYNMPTHDSNNDFKPKDTKVSFGPSKTRCVKNAQTNDSEADDDDDKDSDSGTISARINSIMSSNRSLNVVTCTSSHSHEHLLLIDSGADTCMMGRKFFIESRSGRTVTVGGFGSMDTSVQNLYMGTGITKISFPNKTPFLLRVSDGIITTYKSILSSN